MHGLIFAGLRDYSFQRLPDDEAAAVWADHAYDPGEAYPDEEFRERLEDVRAATGASRTDVEREFGAFAATTTFADLYPDYYAANTGTLPFLLGIEVRIHTVVRATIHGAQPPKLHVRELGDDGVLVSYTSERRLCSVLAGLVEGVASHYGETVAVDEIQCMLRGDPGCVFTVLRLPA